MPFIWDPVSSGPSFIPVGEDVPGGKATGKLRATWINWEAEDAAILLSDSHSYRLVLPYDSESGPEHWQMNNLSQLGSGSARSNLGSMRGGGDYFHEGTDDTSLLEDTFSFKHG